MKKRKDKDNLVLLHNKQPIPETLREAAALAYRKKNGYNPVFENWIQSAKVSAEELKELAGLVNEVRLEKDFQLLQEENLVLIASGKMPYEQIKMTCEQILAARGLDADGNEKAKAI